VFDHDGPNGKTSINIADAHPLGNAGPEINGTVPGGTLIAIDWRKMQVASIRLTAPPRGGQ
jgi:hypothetical protein